VHGRKHAAAAIMTMRVCSDIDVRQCRSDLAASRCYDTFSTASLAELGADATLTAAVGSENLQNQTLQNL